MVVAQMLHAYVMLGQKCHIHDILLMAFFITFVCYENDFQCQCSVYQRTQQPQHFLMHFVD